MKLRDEKETKGLFQKLPFCNAFIEKPVDQADFSQGITFQGTFCHVVVFIANLS